MQSRFLFLDADGREVSAASMEELARHYRAGRLTENSLFYDASTREWAPARVHPLFRTVSGTAVARSAGHSGDAAASAAEAREPVASAEAVNAVDMPEITLVPEGEGDGHVEDFLKTREIERAEEAMQQQAGEVELPLVELGQDSVSSTDFTQSADRGRPMRRRQPASPGDVAPGADATAATTASESARDAVEEAGGDGWRPFRRRGRKKGEGTERRPAPRKRRVPRRVSGERRQFALFMALLAVGGWGIVDAWRAPLQASPVFEEEARVLPEMTAPPLTSELASAHDGAFEDMVEGMDRLRSRLGVDAPPVEWMSGAYLADAGAYPEVPGYWERYAMLADTLAAVEEDLFRSGFVRRMSAQGIQGSVLTIRLARAVRDFREDAQRRRGYYDAMRALSAMATELHGFLMVETARIEYAPAERGLAEDPVLEISTGDPVLMDAIWFRVNRMMAALEAVVGQDPVQRRNVTGQVLDALGGV